MSTVVLVAIVAVAILVLVAVRFGGVWMKFRGERVITCPENHKPAGVQVDAAHAAATAMGSPELRLSSCSRWPEKQDCGQECLGQIEASPEDCLVRTVLLRWYAGKSCALCGKPIGPIGAVEVKPGLLLADGTPADWSEIPAEKLQETLDSASPVCVSCHQATSFARQHPELVVDRHRRA